MMQIDPPSAASAARETVATLGNLILWLAQVLSALAAVVVAYFSAIMLKQLRIQRDALRKQDEMLNLERNRDAAQRASIAATLLRWDRTFQSAAGALGDSPKYDAQITESVVRGATDLALGHIREGQVALNTLFDAAGSLSMSVMANLDVARTLLWAAETSAMVVIQRIDDDDAIDKKQRSLQRLTLLMNSAAEAFRAAYFELPEEHRGWGEGDKRTYYQAVDDAFEPFAERLQGL
jgi:hypothetical protein